MALDLHVSGLGLDLLTCDHVNISGEPFYFEHVKNPETTLNQFILWSCLHLLASEIKQFHFIFSVLFHMC